MRKTIPLIAMVSMLTLLGCDPPAQDNGKTFTPTVGTGQKERVVIEYHQSFQDTTAYGDYRSIVIIKDTDTGREYVGVSGMGVTEIGSHQVGKTQVQDER